MSTEVIAPRNLKFKITTKGIRCDLQNVSAQNCQKLQISGIGNKHRPELSVLDNSVTVESCKRKPEDPLEGRRVKRPKIDRTLKIQCGTLLKELMNHRGAYIFSEPVDPVKLNIPDYFSYVSKPMDLGTIKRKLEGNAYFSADEFADDVKLTFSNATTYNPEGHAVHELAREMSIIFRRRWRSLDLKLKHHVENNHKDTKPIGVVRAQHGEEKPARAALKVCSSLRTTVKKEPCLQRARPCLDRNQSDDVTRVKCPSCAGLVCHCRLKNGSAQASRSDISSERSAEKNKSVNSKQGCVVKRPLALNRRSLSFDSDGPGVVTHEVKSPLRSKPDTIAAVPSEVKSPLRSKPDTIAAVPSEVKSLLRSKPDTMAAVSFEDWSSSNVPMSPNKALRAAMLKSRFADTIFKATHQNAEKLDSSRNREARERLEREKLQEKARIEMEIKAAEAASRRREQSDFKMKRERERAVAKAALEEMERTVVINEGLDIIKDVQTMFHGYLTEKPLEKLGLYFKIDYLQEDEEEDSMLNAEEGEILS